MRAQLSVEMVVISASMIGLLIAMFLVNEYLRSSWESQKQSFQAGAAANRLAMAINQASSSGNGATIAFFNRVGQDITNMSLYDGRSVRAFYLAGGYSSAAISTNNTNVSGSIPLNQLLLIRNVNGTIYVEAA